MHDAQIEARSHLTSKRLNNGFYCPGCAVVDWMVAFAPISRWPLIATIQSTVLVFGMFSGCASANRIDPDESPLDDSKLRLFGF
jgi:hypothetical protein